MLLMSRIAVALALLAVGCDPTPMGYIEVRAPTAQQQAVPVLIFGSATLPPFRAGSVLLRVPTGSNNLKPEGWFQSTYCYVEIRPNRVTTVTLRSFEKPPICVCARYKPNASRETPTCI
jgi:hypothetical protein